MAGRVAYYGNITTQGLILDLDAGRKDSYPRTGTSWIDISGNNNNGTLINGPTYSDGSIVFDGVDDYVRCSTDLGSLTSVTISFWVKPTNPENNGPFVFFSNRLVSSTGLALWITQSKFSSRLNGTQLIGTNTSIANGVWKNLVYKWDGANAYLYVDSILDTTASNASSVLNGAANLSIAAETYGGDNADLLYLGETANTQIYNRALTQTEITQNFNALRGRYGI